MKVQVYKAARMTDRSGPTPDLRVTATEECPSMPTLKDAGALHTAQGRALGESIFDHLPGGTIDALMAYMMERRASLFRVRFDA